MASTSSSSSASLQNHREDPVEKLKRKPNKSILKPSSSYEEKE